MDTVLSTGWHGVGSVANSGEIVGRNIMVVTGYEKASLWE